MSTGKTHFRFGDAGENYIYGKEFETREAAIEEASERAASAETKVVIYQAIAIVKPERAPVAVQPLS